MTARSAVVAGLVTAAAWLVLVFVTGQVDWCTAIVLPIFFGGAAWQLRVAWLGIKRARRLRTLTKLYTKVEPKSPEWNSFERAWSTATRLDKLARRALPEPFATNLRTQVESTARDMYGLASYASELARRVKMIDAARLAAEATQLRDRRATVGGDAAAAIDRSLNAVSDTQAVLDRMTAAHEVALAQLVSDTYVLEGLHARTLELGAVLKASPASPQNALDDLVFELEGLRQSVAEMMDFTRRALDQSAP